MNKLLDLLIKLIKPQFEVGFDQKELAKFIKWLFNKVSMAEIAERFDPVIKGKALVETVDDKFIFEVLVSVDDWANKKLKDEQPLNPN